MKKLLIVSLLLVLIFPLASTAAENIKPGTAGYEGQISTGVGFGGGGFGSVREADTGVHGSNTDEPDHRYREINDRMNGSAGTVADRSDTGYTINRVVADNNGAYWVKDKEAGKRAPYSLSLVLNGQGLAFAFQTDMNREGTGGQGLLPVEHITLQSSGSPGMEVAVTIGDPWDTDASLYKTLTAGFNGPEVARLKHRMFELRYYKNNTVNESYTRTTAEYVKRFEAMNGLPADGVADPEMQALFFSDRARKADGTFLVPADHVTQSGSASDGSLRILLSQTDPSIRFSVAYNAAKGCKPDAYEPDGSDLVVINAGGRDSAMEVSLYLMNRDSNPMGNTQGQSAREDGFQTFLSISNGDEFVSVEYEITLRDEDPFTRVQSLSN